MSQTDPLATLSVAEARHIDQTCDRFEAAWKSGQRPQPHDYFGAIDEPARSGLLRQLLLLDWVYRRRAGEDPRASDYHQRYPADSALIEEVSREMSEAPVSTHLNSARAGTLDTPWANERTSDGREVVELKGTGRAERYDLVREVGHGGIGIVYRSRDRHLGRELAIKVLRDDYRDNAEARCRFLEEARIGSQMQHPAIVPVYELGRFGDGRPYFTMKLVEGHTLAALLRERRDAGQDLPRFLAIFEQVCQALAYAHARGIVHRDLKPANIMVGTFGEVQVMDWGFAKRLQILDRGLQMHASDTIRIAQSAVANAVSHSGVLMGTPSYMPPEQARGEAALIDARADVFALGAILCEILTGRPPYVGSADEVCALAAAGNLADAYTQLDACGADEALRALARRCLVADREKRPVDAAAVARDVTAYLASAQERLRQAELDRAAAEARAVEAGAKASAERRSRRLTGALAAAAVLLVLAAAAVPAVGFVLVRAEQQETEKQRLAAVSAREDEARRRLRAQQALDLVAGPVIKDWLGKQLALSREQKDFLEQALAIYTEFAAETSTDEESQAGLARAQRQVGSIQNMLGRTTEAEKAYDQSAALWTTLLARSPGRIDYRRNLAVVLTSRISVWMHTGRGVEAEAALREMVRKQRQLTADSADPQDRYELAWRLTELSDVCRHRGMLADAEEAAREAATIFEERAAEDHTGNAHFGWAQALLDLGTVAEDTEQLAQAEQAFRAAQKILEPLAAGNPNDSVVYNSLGQTQFRLAGVLRKTRKMQEAEAAAREGVKVFEKLRAAFPATSHLSLQLGQTYNHLGNLMDHLGRPKDAEQAFRSAIVLFEKLCAAEPQALAHQFGLAHAQFHLADPLRKLNRAQESDAANLEALRLLQSLVSKDPQVPHYRHYLAGALVNRAFWHAQRREWSEAQRLLEEAMPHHQAAIEANPRARGYRQYLCHNRLNLALTYLEQDQHEAAAAAADQHVAAATAGEFPLDLMKAARCLARCATLAEKDDRLGGLQREELAQSYADRAMVALRLAVKHGYRNAAELGKNADLASLRARPDFQELVLELQKAPKMP
jgi:tetratricopeptide (TPR) repeat protein/tRNA A-37 threonylcarbamoyl transferase component Bud32